MAKFIIKKRKKVIEIEMPPVIGISGLSRCGKDTFAYYLARKLRKMGLISMKVSLADPIKDALDPILKRDFGISAFTNDNKEKDFNRPLLVANGTDLGRKKDENFWIDKLKAKVARNTAKNIITIISDVRHLNEVKWIQDQGGYVIHVTKINQKPANFQERYHNPIVKRIANYRVRWREFKNHAEDAERVCQFQLFDLFQKNNWSTYGKFNWYEYHQKNKNKVVDVMPPLPLISENHDGS